MSWVSCWGQTAHHPYHRPPARVTLPPGGKHAMCEGNKPTTPQSKSGPELPVPLTGALPGGPFRPVTHASQNLPHPGPKRKTPSRQPGVAGEKPRKSSTHPIGPRPANLSAAASNDPTPWCHHPHPRPAHQPPNLARCVQTQRVGFGQVSDCVAKVASRIEKRLDTCLIM
jgi:hypothetical protein